MHEVEIPDLPATEQCQRLGIFAVVLRDLLEDCLEETTHTYCVSCGSMTSQGEEHQDECRVLAALDAMEGLSCHHD